MFSFQVAQKKDIRRQKERFEALQQEEEEEKERVKEAARQRVLRDFERGDLGLGIGHHLDKHTTGSADTNERAFHCFLVMVFLIWLILIFMCVGSQGDETKV